MQPPDTAQPGCPPKTSSQLLHPDVPTVSHLSIACTSHLWPHATETEGESPPPPLAPARPPRPVFLSLASAHTLCCGNSLLPTSQPQGHLLLVPQAAPRPPGCPGALSPPSRGPSSPPLLCSPGPPHAQPEPTPKGGPHVLACDGRDCPHRCQVQCESRSPPPAQAGLLDGTGARVERGPWTGDPCPGGARGAPEGRAAGLTPGGVCPPPQGAHSGADTLIKGGTANVHHTRRTEARPRVPRWLHEGNSPVLYRGADG